MAARLVTGSGRERRFAKHTSHKTNSERHRAKKLPSVFEDVSRPFAVWVGQSRGRGGWSAAGLARGGMVARVPQWRRAGGVRAGPAHRGIFPGGAWRPSAATVSMASAPCGGHARRAGTPLCAPDVGPCRRRSTCAGCGPAAGDALLSALSSGLPPLGASGRTTKTGVRWNSGQMIYIDQFGKSCFVCARGAPAVP